jgi:hypothetical protein
MGTRKAARAGAREREPGKRTEGAVVAILGVNMERIWRALAVPFLSWDFALSFCGLIPQGETGAVNA